MIAFACFGFLDFLVYTITTVCNTTMIAKELIWFLVLLTSAKFLGNFVNLNFYVFFKNFCILMHFIKTAFTEVSFVIKTVTRSIFVTSLFAWMDFTVSPIRVYGDSTLDFVQQLGAFMVVNIVVMLIKSILVVVFLQIY